MDIEWSDDEMYMATVLSSVADEHPTEPVADEHPTEPVADEHPTEPVADEHPTEPVADEHPTEPVADEHPTEPVADEHPTEPDDMDIEWSDDEMYMATVLSSVADEHPTEPVADEHPTEPVADEHPTEPVADEHPTEPVADEHPTEPVADEHPTEPVADEHPTEPDADIRELKTDLSNRSEEESPTLPGDEALEEQRIAETDYVDNISTKQSDECETGSSVTSSVPIPTKSPLQESDQSSGDDIPLIQVQQILRKRKIDQNKAESTPSSEPSDLDDGNCLDRTYVPSSECSSNSETYSPDVTKRRRKWVRKRNRPLKREEGRRCEEARMKTVLQKSKDESKLQSMLKRFAETRVSSILASNGMNRIKISKDGNCFYNAIAHQLTPDITASVLRSKLCEHLTENKQHYIGYTKGNDSPNKYDKMVRKIENNGMWNTEMSDVLPLAAANVLHRNITIYTSRLNSPIINITPDLHTDVSNTSNESAIMLVYIALRGFEHYDACVCAKSDSKSTVVHPPSSTGHDECTSTDPSVSKTPTKSSHILNKRATPRKPANYVSPKAKKLTRKKERNVLKWKKTIRKSNRNLGKAYISASKSKREYTAKSVQPSNCKTCKNKCNERIKEETRKQIFDTYYDETMTYERKRDFICEHVTSNRYGRTRKHETRKFYLPVGKGKIQVCKQFFLRTLCIGDKLIRCTLKRKQHGMYSGIDNRGKRSPSNKTDNQRIVHVKRHIESFPVIESHYQRKSTARKFLDQNLSIRKMHELYKLKCEEDQCTPVSEKVYRTVFCREYNLSFHKPKKDSCQTCHSFMEKKKTGSTTQEDEDNYAAHIMRKEQARVEKEADKKRAASDKTIYTASFDLQAVLQTPCSNVSQAYYKRKLNSYNLTFFSLADKKGSCYVWNEVHGKRGSSEIGTCVITHLNSLPPAVKHVILYSDCCSGQNRNQFLASALLHTVCRHPTIEIIEQKFLESGHAQMECDSMHSAIEHAKKQTSLFVPDQWDTIFQMARRHNPYTVVPLRYDNFYDLKSYSKTNFKNFKIDTNGNKVNWLKVKLLKVTSTNIDEIQVKYNFDDNITFTTIKLARAQRGRPSDRCNTRMPMVYTQKLPISSAKKKDLLDLCRSYIIPEIYWKFYEDLPTNKSIKDRLPCPDMLEDESDSDNE